MFYGQGAGAGATASAVVGDLMQIMCSGVSCKAPVFEKSENIAPFENIKCRHYLAFPKEAEAEVLAAFAGALVIESSECSIYTESMTEGELISRLAKLSAAPLSHIRELA